METLEGRVCNLPRRKTQSLKRKYEKHTNIVPSVNSAPVLRTGLRALRSLGCEALVLSLREYREAVSFRVVDVSCSSVGLVGCVL